MFFPKGSGHWEFNSLAPDDGWSSGWLGHIYSDEQSQVHDTTDNDGCVNNKFMNDDTTLIDEWVRVTLKCMHELARA